MQFAEQTSLHSFFTCEWNNFIKNSPAKDLPRNVLGWWPSLLDLLWK